jgi:hypothetical protein
MNEMQMELKIIYAHNSSQSSRANARATLLVILLKQLTTNGIDELGIIK